MVATKAHTAHTYRPLHPVVAHFFRHPFLLPPRFLGLWSSIFMLALSADLFCALKRTGLGWLNWMRSCSLSELWCTSASAGTYTSQYVCSEMALFCFQKGSTTVNYLARLLAQSTKTRSLYLFALAGSQQRNGRVIVTNKQPKLQTFGNVNMLTCIGTSCVRPQQRRALRGSHNGKHNNICSKI